MHLEEVSSEGLSVILNMAVIKQFCAQELLILTTGVQKLQTILVESNELPVRERKGEGRKQTLVTGHSFMAHTGVLISP